MDFMAINVRIDVSQTVKPVLSSHTVRPVKLAYFIKTLDFCVTALKLIALRKSLDFVLNAPIIHFIHKAQAVAHVVPVVRIIIVLLTKHA